MGHSNASKTDRPSADRPVRVRFDKRNHIDAEKVAEVLIRLALRASDGEAAPAGEYLRHLLTPGGTIRSRHDDHGVVGTDP